MSGKEEGYQGVRFRTEMVGKKAPDDYRIEELKYWCKIFNDYNLAPPYPGGSFGNLSFRVQQDLNTFIITTAKTGLGALTSGCFAQVFSVDLESGLESGIVYAAGEREPSSESMVHFALYRKRPEINAIFHGHSPEILGSAHQLGALETEREVPYGTLALVEEVLKIPSSEQFFVMKNHGFVALGSTMEEAGELALRMYRQCVRIPTLV